MYFDPQQNYTYVGPVSLIEYAHVLLADSDKGEQKSACCLSLAFCFMVYRLSLSLVSWSLVSLSFAFIDIAIFHLILHISCSLCLCICICLGRIAAGAASTKWTINTVNTPFLPDGGHGEMTFTEGACVVQCDDAVCVVVYTVMI